MASDNSDSDDSLNDFQLIDNIKKEDNSQIKRRPASSSNSSEENNTSIIQSPAKKVFRNSASTLIDNIKKEQNSQIKRSLASSTSSSDENNTSIIQSPVKKFSRNSGSTLTDNIKKKKNAQIKRSLASNASSSEENNTSIIQSPAIKVSRNSGSTLTDNIKKIKNSQIKRSLASSNSLSEENNTSIIQPPAKKVSRNSDSTLTARRSLASSASSSEENNTSIIQSPAIKVSRNSDSTLTARRSLTSSTSSSEENNTSIIQSSAKKISRNSDSTLSPNLQHYLSKYEGQFIPQTGVAKALDAIESDEEVFIVQASKDLNLKEFVGNKLKIKKMNNLETSDGITLEYYVENFTKKPNLTLICGEKSNSAMKVNTIKPSGKIIIREKLFTDETERSDALHVESLKKVPFPRDLTIRHPLFGAFYEDKINLSNKIIKQLQSPRKTKKNKIKIEHSVEKPFKMEQLGLVDSAEETPTKKHKKSKKMKLEQEGTVASDVADNIVESIIGHSAKKKKIKIEKFDDDNDLSWLTNI